MENNFLTHNTLTEYQFLRGDKKVLYISLIEISQLTENPMKHANQDLKSNRKRKEKGRKKETQAF